MISEVGAGADADMAPPAPARGITRILILFASALAREIMAITIIIYIAEPARGNPQLLLLITIIIVIGPPRGNPHGTGPKRGAHRAPFGTKKRRASALAALAAGFEFC